jgi:hypothetical protein
MFDKGMSALWFAPFEGVPGEKERQKKQANEHLATPKVKASQG